MIRHLVRLVERDEREPRTAPLLQEGAMSDFEDPSRESGRSSELELREHSQHLRTQFLELILRICRIAPSTHQSSQRGDEGAQQVLSRANVSCLGPFYCFRGYMHPPPDYMREARRRFHGSSAGSRRRPAFLAAHTCASSTRCPK